MLIRLFAVWSLPVALMTLGAPWASGQSYPARPVRIVTFLPGGSADFAARLISTPLAAVLGQPVVVDNRPSNIIQAQIVSKAQPDGHTLLLVANSFTLAPLFQKVPYDPVKEFSPIALLTTSPNILVVHPSVPVKSVKDLIDLAKAKPGELNYASTGEGGSSHLAAEIFKSMTGVDIMHIPHKAAGPALISLLSAQVQVMFASASSSTPHIKSGKLRPVAVTSAQPSALVPGVPTIAATVPGYESTGTSALFAPARTPAAIIKRLNQEIVRILHTPDVKEKFLNSGTEVVGSTPEQLAAAVKSDQARVSRALKVTGR